jgi:hypothetical protein
MLLGTRPGPGCAAVVSQIHHGGPGALAKAEDVFKPIRDFLEPVLDFVGPIPHPARQGMFDPIYPPGPSMVLESRFFHD